MPPSDPRTVLSTRQGFTLLELSVVLIIIGLLGGAILVGRDLIRSSEIRSILTDVSRFRVAVNGFHDKYNGYPGDMTNAYTYFGAASGCTNSTLSDSNPAGCNGLGTGMISYVGDMSTPSTDGNYRAWQQLALAGLINGAYTGVHGPDSVRDDVIGSNVPASRVSGVGYRWLYSPTTAGDQYAFAGFYGNYLKVGMDSGLYGDGNSWLYSPFLLPGEMLSLDQKQDDGIPGTGLIRAQPNGSNPNCTTSNDGTVSRYNTSYTGAWACSLIYTVF